MLERQAEAGTLLNLLPLKLFSSSHLREVSAAQVHNQLSICCEDGLTWRRGVPLGNGLSIRHLGT
jgi:hypothetical protein